MKPTERFSSRVADYVRYRPSYPEAAIELLRAAAGSPTVADIGAGPGNLTRLLAPWAPNVWAVEPNEAMREAGVELLREFPNVQFLDGSAEATGLPDNSVDLITCGQSFHWFDLEPTIRKFRRILRHGGSIALIWNIRRSDTPFMSELGEVLAQASGESGVKDDEGDRIARLFEGADYREHHFPYAQSHGREDFIGRIRSSSYAPLHDSSFFQRLNDLFDRHSAHEVVDILYTTNVHLGIQITKN
ncbi:MAG: class I SAM-dependent methyltransferase [Fimbriimonas sp.]